MRIALLAAALAGAPAAAQFAAFSDLPEAIAQLRAGAGASKDAAAADADDARFALWKGAAVSELLSPAYAFPPFDRAVLSWNAAGAASFELIVDGKTYRMGDWGDAPRSVKADGVEVDTLVLKKPAKSLRFRAKPASGSTVTLVAVTVWKNGERRPLGRARSAAWGRVIDVPQRSQRAAGEDRAKVCSPTSLAMVLEHMGFKRSTEEIAAGVYDHAEKIYGNWPFNTAHAHRATGLEAYVRRFSRLEALESEIAAGRPVIVSHRWEKGELDGAPIARTDGHVVVVAGFTADGDVVVNDPAGKPGAVRRVYKRAQIQKTWLERGSGIAYILRRP